MSLFGLTQSHRYFLKCLSYKTLYIIQTFLFPTKWAIQEPYVSLNRYLNRFFRQNIATMICTTDSCLFSIFNISSTYCVELYYDRHSYFWSEWYSQLREQSIHPLKSMYNKYHWEKQSCWASTKVSTVILEEVMIQSSGYNERSLSIRELSMFQTIIIVTEITNFIKHLVWSIRYTEPWIFFVAVLSSQKC